MSFNEGAQLDPSQVEDRRGSSGGGMGRGGKAGIGIGGALILLIGGYFGINSGLLNGIVGALDGGQTQQEQLPASNGAANQCKTGADANKKLDCRITATANSLNAFWPSYLKQVGATYTPIKTVIFSGSTNTACGPASTEVGPFYCPGDKKAYFDPAFFQELVDRFGSSGGQLAQEYVVAHEFGHHIQDILGSIGNAQNDPQGPASGSVRVELQADCYAGIWMRDASTTKDPQSGQPFLAQSTQKDLADALSAASSVGDDRIQKAATGRTNPESWTHGSSAQRQKWLTAGYQSGDINKYLCTGTALTRPHPYKRILAHHSALSSGIACCRRIFG
ncbi:neutral zinc metallopeptidase family [Renibacterium salmoninarum ATCC 33209]|uniref:Neutral zinc metallopeptidase family n=1 Tax=Renibacterium salmoninarum (strain ATCC 33209 / DSM 20767 / JCM 11484 / NBRC 15589 / NCIMB 2235) TaxID=288705 RepID=A9WSQ5_RENSM|nr:neutral zinc metallopeptidase [Renibacterium salmoninarum]ABY23843.1 neutral zinc metallopeptidase family [Renibacterium salmoninarum ATCC 33209]